jgi:hypothetical protein
MRCSGPPSEHLPAFRAPVGTPMMRRRVVCPRSHPASPYARPFQGLAYGSQYLPGGRPPEPPDGPPAPWRPVAAHARDGALRGPEGRFRAPGPASSPAPLPLFPPPAPSPPHPPFPSLRLEGRTATSGATATPLTAHAPPSVSLHGPQTPRATLAPLVHGSPRWTALPVPAGEPPRLPEPCPRSPGTAARGGRWVTWTRSSVRVQGDPPDAAPPRPAGPLRACGEPTVRNVSGQLPIASRTAICRYTLGNGAVILSL